MKSSSVDVMGASMDHAIAIKRHLEKCVDTLEAEEEWRKDDPRESEEVRCLSEWIIQWKGLESSLIQVIDMQPRTLAHDHLKEPTSLHETLGVLALPLCEKRTSSNCKCILEVTEANYDACRIKRECDPSTNYQTKEGPLNSGR